MSVKVRQAGDDVAVQDLATPIQIKMRNAAAVHAWSSPADEAGANRTAQTYIYTCVDGTIDTKLFNCTGLTELVAVACNGTAFSGKMTCPIREPACRYWDTATSAWSSDGCTVAGTTDDGLYTICECTHLTDFSTEVQQSLALVTEHFDNVIHHVVTLDDIKNNIALVIVIVLFFVLYVVVFFYVSRWNRQDKLRALRERHLKQTETKYIKIRSLFQQPEYLHAVGWKAKLKAAAEGFLRGLKENHKLMSIVFKYNEHFSRVQRLTIIFAVIMSQMFTNALLYKLKQGPKSKGSAFVAGVISPLCMVPVTIAFVAMFKKAARKQNYLVRYQVEDENGNVEFVETDAYGTQHEHSPDEILKMDLAAVASCVDIPRIQKVADELKHRGVDSKVGQLCRGIFVALYNRDADEEPPETGDGDESDPLKGIVVQIKSHLQSDSQRRCRSGEESRSRISSMLTLDKRRSSRTVEGAGSMIVTAASDSHAPRSADSQLVVGEDLPMSARKALIEEERQALAVNQLLLMLGRGGGGGMVNDMLNFDPLQTSASSGAKITEISEFVERALEEEESDNLIQEFDAEDDNGSVTDVMLTLQDWLAKCSESWVKQQANAKLVVAKAKRELERTESQLKKLQYAIGAQFERRLSEVIARAEDAMPETLRAPMRDPQAVVAVHLPTTAEKKQASQRRMSRLSRNQQGPSAAQLVPGRRLTVAIKQEKNAFLKANRIKLKEQRAVMTAAQRKTRDEQRKLRQNAKRELQKLMDGLHGVAKMKKKLQLYLEAREQKRIDALPSHEKQVYLLEKKELQKIERTSCVLYNQFLRRQSARVSWPLFPEWVIYISYLICLGWSIWSAFFVMMFGFTIGHVESQLWISSLVTGMAMAYVVSDPLKIFFRMGLMPIVAVGILADSGIFNALGSEASALSVAVAVSASGAAQYVAKRMEKKRPKRAKVNRLVPTDQEVFAQALEIAAKEANEDHPTTAAADAEAQHEQGESSTVSERSLRQGSFTDISRAGVRDAVLAQRQEIQAELEADERTKCAAAAQAHGDQGAPLQLVHSELAGASGSIARSPMKTVEQQSSSALKDRPVSTLFGPNVAALKPPVGPVSPAKPSTVMPSTGSTSSAQARTGSPATASVSHLCRCGETAREQDWTIHQQDVCSHRMVQCRAGCAMFLGARSRNGHELSQRRLTMCNCGKMVLTKSLELHQQRECRNKTVFCRLNCGASMPSHQRERHERHECARRIATCVNCGCVRHAADMDVHLATECELHRAKAAVSHAIVAAYSPSPVLSPPKLNAATIRGPPITSIQSAATKRVGRPTMELAAVPIGSPAPSVPGLVRSDDASSPEKQKLEMMRAKVLARKAASSASSGAEMKDPSASDISSIRAGGDEVHPLRSASAETSTAHEVAGVALPATGGDSSSGQKMSPIRKKMMARPPHVPDDGTSSVSPREDEVLAAAASMEPASTRSHGVDDQVDELAREFFGAAAKE